MLGVLVCYLSLLCSSSVIAQQYGSYQPTSQNTGAFPNIFSGILGNFNNQQQQQPPPVKSFRKQEPLPSNLIPPAVNAPMNTATIPDVYGPLSANWSSCPLGFDCCGGLVYADPQAMLECCGQASYDRRYQQCSMGVISPLSETSAAEAAAATPTPLTRLNCGGYLYVGRESYRCCNFDVYDPESQQCKNGKIIKLPLPSTPQLPTGSVYLVCGNYKYILACAASLTWGCCGQDLYNYNTENCTAAGITPPRTPTTQSQVPAAQGLLVFCLSIRYWVEPSGLPTVRCCADRLCSAMIQPALGVQSSQIQNQFPLGKK